MVRTFRAAFFILTLILFACSRDQNAGDLLQAIPVNAVLIAEVNNAQKAVELGTSNRLWERLDSNAYLKTSLSEGRAVWNEFLSGTEVDGLGRFSLSFHESGANSYDVLLVLKREDHPYLEEVYGRWAEARVEEARTYDGETIIRIDLTKSGRSYYAAESRGLIVASESDLLVEDALRQLKAKVNLLTTDEFASLHRTANRKDPVNLYIQYDALGEWAGTRMKAGSFAWLERGAEWTELDLSFKTDRLIASGLTHVSDSVVNYMSLFRDNPSRKNQLLDLLPNNTAAVTAISFENFASYQRDYEKLLRQLNRSDKLLLLKDQSTKYKAYTSWVDTEFGLALLENPGADWAQSSIGLIKFRDKRLAEEALGNQATADITKYNDFVIRKIEDSSFPTVFGRVFKAMNTCYYTTYRDYVIIAPQELLIKQFLNDNRGGRTLNDDKGFAALRGELSSKSHVFLYAENPQAISLLQAVTRAKYGEGLSSRKEEWNEIAAVAWQLEMEDAAAHTQLIVRYRTEEQAETRLQWATELDTLAGMEPIIIKNHYSKRFEVLVQDVNHTLYLIDARGDVQWRRALDGPIRSEVHQLDRYKNGKLQFVFNTESTLYMLDRNGKDVEDYPINLPGAVTAKVAVFDYDRNRNYRIFIACGTRILLYGVDGKPVSGWEYGTASSEVIGSPTLYQIGGRDYLAFFTSDGQVSLRNRRGQERVTLGAKLDLRDPELFLIKGQTLSDSRLVGLSKSGQLTNVFFNGSVDMTDIGIVDPEAYFAQFKGHQILLEGKEVRVSGPEVNYTYTSKTPLDRSLKTFDMGPHFVLGIQHREGRELWLLNASGNIRTGFPVTGDLGMTIRDLDLDGKLDLIVADREGYVYNYALD